MLEILHTQFLVLPLLYVTGALSIYYFLAGTVRYEDRLKLENWAHLLYASWAITSIKTGECEITGVLIVSTCFYVGSIVSFHGWNNMLYLLTHRNIRCLDWSSIQSDDMALFMGHANISGRKTSSVEDIITYDLTFTHPVDKDWYYATFFRIITCTKGEIKFKFKDSGSEVVLKEGDSLSIHRREIVSISTLKDSKITTTCIK